MHYTPVPLRYKAGALVLPGLDGLLGLPMEIALAVGHCEDTMLESCVTNWRTDLWHGTCVIVIAELYYRSHHATSHIRFWYTSSCIPYHFL
jgi:hypothetical protein